MLRRNEATITINVRPISLPCLWAMSRKARHSLLNLSWWRFHRVGDCRVVWGSISFSDCGLWVLLDLILLCIFLQYTRVDHGMCVSGNSQCRCRSTSALLVLAHKFLQQFQRVEKDIELTGRYSDYWSYRPRYTKHWTAVPSRTPVTSTERRVQGGRNVDIYVGVRWRW